MLRLFFRSARRPQRPARRTVDPVMTFTPREWADLPVHHPRSEDEAAR